MPGANPAYVTLDSAANDEGQRAGFLRPDDRERVVLLVSPTPPVPRAKVLAQKRLTDNGESTPPPRYVPLANHAPS